MDIVVVFLASLITALLATWLTRQSSLSAAEIGVSLLSSTLTIIFTRFLSAQGASFGLGLSIFLASALTLGLSSIIRRPASNTKL